MNQNDYISILTTMGDESQLNAFFEASNKQLRQCMFPSGCDRGAICAHSISESMLRKICEDSKVIALMYDNEREGERGNISGRRFCALPVQISKASVFTGVCQYHDNLFQPVDQGNITQEEDIFWLAFRDALRGVWHPANEMLKLPETSKFATDVEVHNRLEQSYKRISSKGKRYLNALNRLRKQGDWGNMEHVSHVYTDPNLRIAASTSMTTNFVFGATRPSDMPISVNVLPVDKISTKVIVSMFSSHKREFLDYLPFFDKDSASLDIRKQQDWLSRHLLIYGSNLFFGPNYWHSFSGVKKQTILSYVVRQHYLMSWHGRFDTGFPCANIFESA